MQQHNPNRIFKITEPSGMESIRCYHRGTLPGGYGHSFVPVGDADPDEGTAALPFRIDIGDIRQGWSVSG